MNEIMYILFSLWSGVMLGLIFFGGLWWTIQKLSSVKHPSLLLLTSLLLRTGITLGGFYFFLTVNLIVFLICVFGFFLTRIFLTRFTLKKTEVNHAH